MTSQTRCLEEKRRRVLGINLATALIAQTESGGRRWAEESRSQSVWEKGVIRRAQVIDGRMFPMLLRVLGNIPVTARHIKEAVFLFSRILGRLLLMMSSEGRVFVCTCYQLL